MRGIEPVGVALSESLSWRRIAGIAVASGTMMPSTQRDQHADVAGGERVLERDAEQRDTGSPAR